MTPDPVSTAAELVAAREARGLSADDIQRQLKIHRTQLEALERGEWDLLPGLSFVRAILRSYGRAIDADVEPLLTAIGGHAVSTDIKASASLRAPIRSNGMLGFGSGGSGSRWTWLSLLVLLVMALGLFFGRGEDSLPGGPWRLPGTGSVDTPRPGSTGTQDKTTGASAVSGKKQESGNGGLAAGPGSANEPASGPGHRVTLELTRDGGLDERLLITFAPQFAGDGGQPATLMMPPVPLKLSFASDGWAEVTQADGRVLLKGPFRGGSINELLTVGTVTVNTPYPSRLRLDYDGKSVPLELAPGAKTVVIRLP